MQSTSDRLDYARGVKIRTEFAEYVKEMANLKGITITQYVNELIERDKEFYDWAQGVD